MKTLAILLLATVIIGCSKPEKKESAAPTSGHSSLAKDAIEGITGKTDVMAGEKAKEKIRAISAEQNKKLNEVLDDK